ncbi:fimbrial protein [Enterobacter cloacae complex sp. P6RS]|uniref:fimbrial protein n=1 Tax=unclassified Enterobacter cloacae complex TaxID=2757714 RepID=UPI0018743C39|nr:MULTISPECIES: fimbrial protein [unclassified Enterobacter cloacae complex]MBE4916813.1 fimbrial protein [Enterobacter cloacae complex sp. P4RS]MBE4994522.1 fimbrial protein [Enterobacter cloacae complex sp. P6RS]
MKISVTGFLLVFQIICSAHAEDNMFFHGTLVTPPCTIQNGQEIDVAFGEDLGINKIDGVNYRQNVNYRIVCDTHYMPNELAVVVDSTQPTIFDSSAVQTTKNGLGVRIFVASQPATFGTRIAVKDPNSPPEIEAVPVQDPGITLDEGAFDATMTLRVDYM